MNFLYPKSIKIDSPLNLDKKREIRLLEDPKKEIYKIGIPVRIILSFLQFVFKGEVRLRGWEDSRGSYRGML